MSFQFPWTSILQACCRCHPWLYFNERLRELCAKTRALKALLECINYFLDFRRLMLFVRMAFRLLANANILCTAIARNHFRCYNEIRTYLEEE